MLNSTHMYIQNLKLFLRPSNSDTLESFALFQRIDPPSSARGLCFCYRPLYTCIHASRQCADGATEEFLQVVFNHDKGRFTFSSWKKLQNWAIVKERALRAPAYSPKTPMLCGEQFPARSKPVPPPGAHCPATTSTAAHSEDTTLPAVICHGNSFTLCSAPQLLSQQAAGRAQGSAPEHPSSPGSSSSAAGMLGALHTSHPTAGPPHPKPASKCPSPSSVGRAGLWGSAAPSTPQQLLITVSTVGASMWVMAPARRCAPQNMQLT